MKKLLFISILALLPFFASAQKIDYSTVDDFTGKTVIRTNWTRFEAKTPSSVKVGSRKIFNSYFMFRYEEGHVYLHVEWIGSVMTMKKGSEFQLKLKDGSVSTITAVDDFIANTDVYTAVNFFKSEDDIGSKNILHTVYEGDLSQLSELNLPEKLRISSVYGSEVFDIDSKNARRLAKAYKLISDEIKKSESK
ncbi:hypothetical protein [Dysgonomonas massiliensis]|uniref:hypothetical protein n=1 Tax=Dysgonomonas massiliensis TaxID=2040292 RepID=UPI000C77E901|nr:hypothetical protein [Dysgonomonas massiliensis]